MDLAQLLHGRRSGEWVVVSPDYRELLGAGASPREALRAAGLESWEACDREDTAHEPIDRRALLLQVPSPRHLHVF